MMPIEPAYLVRIPSLWDQTDWSPAETAYAVLYRLPIEHGPAGNFRENWKIIDVRDIAHSKGSREPPPLVIPRRPPPAAHFFVAAWLYKKTREVQFAGWASLSEVKAAPIEEVGPCKVECHAIPFEALHPMSGLQPAIWNVEMVGGIPVRKEKRHGREPTP